MTTTQPRTLANVILSALGEAPIDQRRGADANQPENFRSVMAQCIGSTTFPATVIGDMTEKPGTYRLQCCLKEKVMRDDELFIELVHTDRMIEATPDSSVDVSSIKPGVVVNVLASGVGTFSFTLSE